jgi:hypothetical protein
VKPHFRLYTSPGRLSPRLCILGKQNLHKNSRKFLPNENFNPVWLQAKGIRPRLSLSLRNVKWMESPKDPILNYPTLESLTKMLFCYRYRMDIQCVTHKQRGATSALTWAELARGAANTPDSCCPGSSPVNQQPSVELRERWGKDEPSHLSIWTIRI